MTTQEKVGHFSSCAGATKWSDEERKARIELAATYRMVALMGWDELIYNHLTIRIPGTEHILLNPFGLRFDEVTASSLVKLDLDGNLIDEGSTTYGFNRTGYVIHGAIHRARPDINATLHTHHASIVAVSSLKCGLVHFHQNSFLFGEVAYHDYEGISTDIDEQKRIVAALGPTSKNLILRNHGVVSCGSTIQEAFFYLYQVTKSCEVQIQALSACGGDVSKLNIPTKEISDKSFRISSQFNVEGVGMKEWDCLIRKLDKLDPSYKFIDESRPYNIGTLKDSDRLISMLISALESRSS
ncbi:alpha adducin [Cavenderia fasciculata]|uniref:Alpha adducin n=1 Tax=Cavenderia fasciculata TaxID=261658 RepID=F4PV43_CACFS|nr:alpha adducin [Cavenderia fasciculata]EGG21159.1 alpha adducin [Cavenderia fasciculata]|eukprot:XP_004359009.1 alpha adducin [Cavenderia fasciculata]